MAEDDVGTERRVDHDKSATDEIDEFLQVLSEGARR